MMTAAPTVTGDGDDTTTTEAPMMTTNATTAAERETEGQATTGAPDPGGIQVLPLHGEPGPQSGLEGVALWQTGMPGGCEEPPPASCAALPTLGAPQIMVDGGFPGVDGVSLGSSVVVLFPFAHPACELGCGEFDFTFLIGDGGDGANGFAEIPVDLPCSTEDSGVWLGIDFNRVTLPQQYTAALGLTDRCGATTEVQKLVFTPK